MAKTFKKVGGHKIEVTNADKELFPDDGITKGEVIDYYERIAETMLPHMKDRPLALQRYPDGIEEDGFYQKEAADYFPGFIETVKITLENGSRQSEIVCNNSQGPTNDIEVRKWSDAGLGAAETWKSSWCEGLLRGGDFDGDGKSDLLCDHLGTPVAFAGTSGSKADLLRRVGLGP